MSNGHDLSNKSIDVEIPEVSSIENKTERTPLNQGLFTSNRGDWETPVEVFQELDREFGFELDVCATASNAKCSAFFSPEIDGLKQPWRGRCWMNPPYGRDIGLWMEKAYHSSLQGATVVCLIPARTDTRWWNEWAMRGEIRFLRGRIRFVGALDDAPFPSAIVIFRPKRPTGLYLLGPVVSKINAKLVSNDRLMGATDQTRGHWLKL
jgi:phage N-6-adenine-methyltransferase